MYGLSLRLSAFCYSLSRVVSAWILPAQWDLCEYWKELGITSETESFLASCEALVQSPAPGKLNNTQTSQIIKGHVQEIPEGMKILSGCWGALQAPLWFCTHGHLYKINLVGHRYKIKSYENGKMTHRQGMREGRG